MNPTPGTRPAWVDDDLFPFTSRFVEIDGNVVHYIDEGDGPTLLLLHGNPTWSFLYRDVVAGLRDRFRCVALDYPGFGLSSATTGYRFTAREHRWVVERFVEQLDLADITLMVQDWGGPIGLGAAERAPDRYRALIVGNTWIWPAAPTDLMMQAFSRTLGGPVGRRLIRRFNVFVERLLPAGHVRRNLSDAEMAMYRAPFPTPASREPTAVFPREITSASAYLREVATGVDVMADLPSLIVWADADQAFREPVKRRWERTLPNHTTVDLPGVGHFLQDDAPDEVVAAIADWWSTTT